MSELKACPFCGGEASIRNKCDMDGIGSFHWVECKKCRARSASHFVSLNEIPSYQEVLDEWNSRQYDNKLKAESVKRFAEYVADNSDAWFIDDLADKWLTE